MRLGFFNIKQTTVRYWYIALFLYALEPCAVPNVKVKKETHTKKTLLLCTNCSVHHYITYKWKPHFKLLSRIGQFCLMWERCNAEPNITFSEN